MKNMRLKRVLMLSTSALEGHLPHICRDASTFQTDLSADSLDFHETPGLPGQSLNRDSSLLFPRYVRESLFQTLHTHVMKVNIDCDVK